MTALLTVAKGLDERKWNEIVTVPGMVLMRQFSNAACGDLGLPKLSLRELALDADTDEQMSKFINDRISEVKDKLLRKNQPDKES